MGRLFTRRAVSAAVVLVVGVSGGELASARAGATNAHAATKKIPLAYFAPVENGLVDAVGAGAKLGAAATGGQVIETFAANGSDTTEIKQIGDAVASHRFKGLLIFPLDPSIATAAKAAVKAGLKVAFVDQTVGTNGLTNTSIPGAVISATDPLKYRAQGLARLIIQACAKLNPCNVAYMFGLAQVPSENQVFGSVKAKLESHPSVKIVATGTGNYATQPAESAAANILTAHSDLNVFATTDDDMTYGVQLAMQQAGRTGIKLIGVGASARGCASVKSGAWFGTINDFPKSNGMRGAEAVDEAVKGNYHGPALWDSFSKGHLAIVTTKANAAHCPDQWST